MTQALKCTPGQRGVVLGVHHAGKDGKTLRGSSAFESGVDTVYFTSRDGQVIPLDRQKRKDGPEFDRHQLKLNSVMGTTSAIVEVDRLGGQTPSADKLMSTFCQCFSATGASKAELRNVAQMPAGSFHRALCDLLKSGQLVNVATETRPFYRLAGK